MSAFGSNVKRPDDEKIMHPGLPKPVRRYWQGKAPDWYEGGEEEEEEEELEVKKEEEEEEEEDEIIAPKFAPPVVVQQAQDPRLARLLQREAVDREEAIARHREIAEAHVVSRRVEEESDEEEEEEEDEEAIEARRAAIRERLKQREEEVVAALEEEEEEEEESEYETDSEDEGAARTLLKPIFVKKQERDTIAEREALEKEEEEAMMREKARAEARKAETREIVKTTIELEAAAARAAREMPHDLGDIDTDDEKDEEEQYELWKSREMNRIRREREERDKEAKDAQEREMLKSMTPAQRMQWEKDHPKDINKAPKKKWRFMQKYWHKGAFFQTEGDGATGTAGGDNIYMRDFSEPTGEDKLDKTILPRVMQVKNFGRRGRTKWTHLVDQDTTEWDNPLAPDRKLISKRESKMAGVADVFERPKTLKT